MPKLWKCLLKLTLKMKIRLKRWKICTKIQSISVFVDEAKFADFLWKIGELKRCVTWIVYFLDPF